MTRWKLKGHEEAIDECGRVVEAMVDDEVIGEEDANTAFLLLVGLFTPKTLHYLNKVTGMSKAWIKPRMERLRENGIWSGRDLTFCGWFEEDGDVALICDILVAEGEVIRPNPESFDTWQVKPPPRMKTSRSSPFLAIKERMAEQSAASRAKRSKRRESEPGISSLCASRPIGLGSRTSGLLGSTTELLFPCSIDPVW